MSHAGSPAAGASANPARGEARLVVGARAYVLRPSFGALVAAEDELGPLFALVERAGEGQMRLAEIAALFWHCLAAGPSASVTREEVGEAVLAMGLAAATQPLRAILHQILQGRG